MTIGPPPKFHGTRDILLLAPKTLVLVRADSAFY